MIVLVSGKWACCKSVATETPPSEEIYRAYYHLEPPRAVIAGRADDRYCSPSFLYSKLPFLLVCAAMFDACALFDDVDHRLANL